MPAALEQVKVALADRYAVERVLGSGGMATVFLAQDLKHRRQVAIKVLHPELAAALGSDRFLREIEIAAALQHPHVLPVYDSGDADGLLYYVMPFVEGESLSTRVAREGALPVDEVIRILREVVDALAYAHSRGLVHRDIKPDNVLLSGRHALVADFGVAKAVSAAGGEGLTATGLAIGTPSYMAPEQATADPNVDHRADIYAVGVVAYELLAGQPPFRGPTAQAVVAAHLADTPEPVDAHRSSITPALAALVMRCLEKLPADRAQSAEDLLHALEAMATPSGSTAAAPAAQPAAPRPAQVAGLYALASVAVLGLVYVAMDVVGLPGWVLPGAVLLLAAGFPIMLVTSRMERQRAKGSTLAAPLPEAKGLRRWLTWRRAILGGVVAFAGLTVVAGGYMAMRVLGIGPVGTLMATGVLEERDRIILADFVDRTGDSTLSYAVTEAFRVDLGQSPSVTLVSGSELDEAFARMEREAPEAMTEGIAREVAVREGIKAVVAGEINALGGSYVLSAQLLAAESGEVLVPARETARDSTQIIEAVDRLSNRLRERIGESLRSIRATPPLERVATASLPALRKYSQASRAIDAGESARGIALLKETIALDTAFAAAYRALAIHLGNFGIERALAAESMSKAYRFRDRLPERERLWTAGSYHMQRNEVEAALVPYLELLESEPESAPLVNNIGVLYSRSRDSERALEYYQRAAELEPDMPNSAFNVVVTHIELGRLDSARAANEAWAAQVGDHPVVHANEYFITMSEFDYDAAERALDGWAMYVDASTSSILTALRIQLAAVRGRVSAMQRELEGSEQRARQGLQVPEHLRAVATVAIYDAEVRARPEGALARLESALEQFPLDSLEPFDRPYTELAEAYARAGRPERARTWLEEFDREVPREFRPLAEIDYDHASAYVTLAAGRLEEAVQSFRRADKGGCPVCVLPGLARAYDALGNSDSLLAVLERYVTTPDDDRIFEDPLELAGVYLRLGEVHEARDQRDQAIDYYSRLVDLWQDADPELQTVVSDVRQRIARLVREGAD
jgi:tetratricopeptide (TPR) repeat protein/tRNA A-37 threonylcarbamoyl transferase component Bud32